MRYKNITARYWLFVFALMPLFSFSQVKITGQVLDITTTKPVPATSVFLSNTSNGNETVNDGTFTLYNVKPGSYDLVVSIIGYETNRQTVVINNQDIHLPPIYLIGTSISLKTVRIKPDNNWFRLYKDFKNEFLGNSDYTKQCRILNPDSLNLKYDPEARQLIASSRGFLVIENKALGYRIRYLLQTFVSDYRQKSLVYTGYTIFEELKGNPAEKLDWKKNRLDCYFGSSMHFFRSAIKNQAGAEGFEVYKLKKKARAVDDGKKDSIYRYVITNKLLKWEDYFKETDHEGIYAIVNLYSYVIYKKKLDYGRAPIYKDFDMPNWESSVMLLNQPYVLFDSNGVVTDPLKLSYQGYWAITRVAELLPVDYEP